MNKEINETTKAELSDEELEGVVGEGAQYGALLSYLQATGRRDDPMVAALVKCCKAKDWEKMIDIAAEIGKTYPDAVKYI